MPRKGISFDEVSAVADCMAAANDKVTIKSVRERLGRGSNNTIHKHLSTWRDKQPQFVPMPTEIPLAILTGITQELARVRQEARAEIEERLVIAQDEAHELAAAGEASEAEIENLEEENSALTKHRDQLQDHIREKDSEIERLMREVERERYGSEQARIETAQIRNRIDIQEGKILDFSATIEQLKSENAIISQARIDAEKDAAVLSARLEMGQEATARMQGEIDLLSAQVDKERHSAESARRNLEQINDSYQMQAAALSECMASKKVISELYDLEKAARISAEKQSAVLAARLDEMIQRNQISASEA